MSELTDKIKSLELQKQRLVAEESIIMRKAFESDDPDALIKAQSFLHEIYRRDNKTKSFFIDPSNFTARGGYLTEPNKITHTTLRRMANAPIIKAVIETRVEQVSTFLEPQTDKYSTGFIIKKKSQYFNQDNEEKVTKQDQRTIELLTDFILNCGSDSNKWTGDDFESWGRKTVKDSLILDQVSSEIIRNNKGLPVEFVAVDAATIRLADHRSDEIKNLRKIYGELPSHVQIYQDQILAEFYPWEMMWGIRNPQSAIYTNGYGESELETLISTVTAMLQGDAYNANVFKVGSVPSGIFRIGGNINEARLHEFRQQWSATMAGFSNHGKMGFIEADKMEFVDLSKSNRDMEYSKYQEYLIKLACAIYKISPEEIGFSIQQSPDSNSMFESNNESKLKYSRDKGLKPLLKFLQKNINKYIIAPIAPEYEFAFVGLEAETEEKELEMAMKKASSFKGLKEVRRERGLPDTIDQDDIILNPVYIQWLQMKQMGNQESNQFIDENYQQDDNPFAKSFNEFVDRELIFK